MNLVRYAICFAPAFDSPWWEFGCRWLGRDPVTGQRLALPDFAGQLPDWEAITEAPRRYGFHGTLKAPFVLAPESSERELYAVARVVAGSRKPFRLPPLRVECLSDFVALRPSHASVTLELLAEECVIHFDRCRAPLSEEERERWREAGLTSWQEKLFTRWGYPYVFDQYRFHMTLTGPLPESRRQSIVDLLQPLIEPLNAAPPWVDAICVFHQLQEGAPFRVAARFGFDGSVEFFEGG